MNQWDNPWTWLAALMAAIALAHWAARAKK